MNTALIFYGPSGSGKTTIINEIVKDYPFKHCDTDEFKLLFSSRRSEERTAVGSATCLAYAQELVKRRYNIIVESLPDEYLNRLKRLLKKERYRVIEISLKATLAQCLTNNRRRKGRRRFSDKGVCEAYKWYSYERGFVIDRAEHNVEESYELIKKRFLGKKAQPR
jgi:adenylate kinase family enzyme